MVQLIADSVRESMERSSWIREMFEQGARMIAELGEEQVFDFTLGNPLAEPPEGVHEALHALLRENPAGMHRYPPNAGLPEVREFVAAELSRYTGLPYTAGQVVMTCGAGGALNVLFKAILNPGDEIIALAPYFVEYNFYAQNHGGQVVPVPTDESFQIDAAAVDKAITPRTRAVMVNSPNNPTGAVYSEDNLRVLADVLRAASQRVGHPILMVSDEPYRYLIFDGLQVPWIPKLYDYTVVATSFSKDLGLAGERMGYIAVSPSIEGHEVLMDAIVLANRILGFVIAPTLIQRVLPILGSERVDAGFYQRLRDLMLPPLEAMGYDIVKPGGAFYLFPRSPIPDDVEFVKLAQEERLLVVPGSGFGGPGYFRIALCVDEKVIDRSLPVFEKVLALARG